MNERISYVAFRMLRYSYYTHYTHMHNPKEFSKLLKDKVIHELEENSIEEIVHFDMSKASWLSEYVIIGSARSARHGSSISEKIAQIIKKDYAIPANIAGGGLSEWTLLDFGDVMLHLLTKDARDHYNIEQALSSILINADRKEPTSNLHVPLSSS